MFKKVYIEITNICNKNCSFCSKTNREKKEMSIEEFSHTLEEVQKVTDYIYLHVKGEPFLYSNIEKLINICDEKKIKVNITTNGTLLKKYKNLICSSTSIRQINISLHSYNNKENLEDLFNTVDEIKEKTNIYLVYRYWLGQKNFLENYAIKNLLNHYKFTDKLIDKIMRESNIKIGNNLYINKDEEFIWPSLDNNIYEEYGTCLGLKNHIAILSDGTVIPCCLDSEGIINLGNIFTESIESILEKKHTKDILKNFKDNKKIEELCRHCSFKK